MCLKASEACADDMKRTSVFRGCFACHLEGALAEVTHKFMSSGATYPTPVIPVYTADLTSTTHEANHSSVRFAVPGILMNAIIPQFIVKRDMTVTLAKQDTEPLHIQFKALIKIDLKKLIVSTIFLPTDKFWVFRTVFLACSTRVFH